MLIPFSRVRQYCMESGIEIKGILHIGAHECEELADYITNGLFANQIYWVEGNKELVEKMKQKGIPNMHHSLLSDKEEEVIFHITSNGQSSSILSLKTHSTHYPWITVSKEEKMRTTTLRSLIEKQSIPIQTLNFWNLDIQGAELLALKGGQDFLQYADVIYTEVNVEELYEGCVLFDELKGFLESHGFELIGQRMVEQGWGDAFFIKHKK
jgi:FkbM family methyltransferase